MKYAQDKTKTAPLVKSCIVLVSIFTILQAGIFHAEVTRVVLKYDDSYVPSSVAIAQSNLFAIGKNISAPLVDGWQNQGFRTTFDRSGKFDSKLSSSLVVDCTKDKVLLKTITEAKAKYKDLPKSQLAQVLTKFAHAKFTPSNMNAQELCDWDDSYGNIHKGERILLGEYILQGRGVCEEEAVLLKVLADQFDLPCTLMYGFDSNVSHVWTVMRINGKDLVYDPAQSIFGANPNSIEGHKTIQALYGKDSNLLKAAILANDEIEKHDYKNAEIHLKLMCTLDLKVLGKEHPTYAVSLERLADLYKLEDKESEAEPVLEKALEVCIAVHGDIHQMVADCTNDLANLESSMGKVDKAEKLYKKAIKIYSLALGDGDASVADPMYNLANLYQEQGDDKRAEKLYRQALAIYQETKGPNSEDALDTASKLKSICKVQVPQQKSKKFTKIFSIHKHESQIQTN